MPSYLGMMVMSQVASYSMRAAVALSHLPLTKDRSSNRVLCRWRYGVAHGYIGPGRNEDSQGLSKDRLSSQGDCHGR